MNRKSEYKVGCRHGESLCLWSLRPRSPSRTAGVGGAEPYSARKELNCAKVTLAHARIAMLVPMSSPAGLHGNDGGSVSAPAIPLSVPLGRVTRRRQHWTAEGAGCVIAARNARPGLEDKPSCRQARTHRWTTFCINAFTASSTSCQEVSGSGACPDSVRFRHHQFEGRLPFSALTTGARPVTPSGTGEDVAYPACHCSLLVISARFLFCRLQMTWDAGRLNWYRYGR
jgi:hypothetical protein